MPGLFRRPPAPLQRLRHLPPPSGYRDLILLDGPIAYWRLGEPSGTNADDQVGPNDGTYVNAPTFGTAGISGDGDTAVTFNGTDETVTVASSTPFRFAGTLPFTVEAWLNHTSDATFRRLVSCEDGGNGQGWQLYSQNTGSGLVRTGASADEVGAGILSAGWHHFVGTYDGTTMRLYLDGSEVGGGQASSVSLPSTSTFRIASHSSDVAYFNGALDEVAIYNYALSAVQVAAHFAAGSIPAGAFDPATGFPWGSDRTEPFTVSQHVPEPDLAIAFGTTQFNPNAGFPFNRDDSERFVVETFRPDDTLSGWTGQPVAAPAFNPAAGFPWNRDEAIVVETFVVDPTEPVRGYVPPQIQAWPVDGGETQATSATDDTSQAWAVGPPLNVVRLSAFPGDSEVTQQVPVEDPSVQSWPAQQLAVVAFDPATGFPWNRDDSERFAQQQLIDDNIGWAFGRPPLNAVTAQAFNQPDEAAFVAGDDPTVPALVIQPPAAAPFDPATGFPWTVDAHQVLAQPVEDSTSPAYPIGPPAFDPASVPWSRADDIIQPVWSIVDATVQSWSVGPPPMLRAFNQPQPEPIPAWFVDDMRSQAWAATFGIEPTFIGGAPPEAIAYHLTPAGVASAPAPTGTATHPTPE